MQPTESHDRAQPEGVVRIGTSGYSFKDWVGTFYPPGTSARQQLAYYAERFNCLEVNVTYYRIPDAKLFAGMCERTPAGFEFIVKLHGDMTHHRSRDDELYRQFHAALQPLQDEGRLHGLLAQFPFSFKNAQENRAFVAELRQRFEGLPLFVELRHESWILEPMFQFLRKLGIGYVSVDEPQLRGLVPPVTRATTEVGYVRLHGRNAANWYVSGSSGSERYDYLYNPDELREWADKIRRLLQETRKTYVFFNNCHAGKAPANAQAMKELLEQFGGAEPVD